MTCNVEEVEEEDSLGSSVPLTLTVLEDTACSNCGYQQVICDYCGNEFCKICEKGIKDNLVFDYCDLCVNKLDPQDPSMNLDLLKVIQAEDSKQLIADIGVERYF